MKTINTTTDITFLTHVQPETFAFLLPGVGWIFPEGKISDRIKKAAPKSVRIKSIQFKGKFGFYLGFPTDEEPTERDLAWMWTAMPLQAQIALLNAEMRFKKDCILLKAEHSFFFECNRTRRCPETMMDLIQTYLADAVTDGEFASLLAAHQNRRWDEVGTCGPLHAVLARDTDYMAVPVFGGGNRLVPIPEGEHVRGLDMSVIDVISKRKFGATAYSLMVKGTPVDLNPAKAPAKQEPILDRAVSDGVALYGETNGVKGYGYTSEAQWRVTLRWSREKVEALAKAMADANAEAVATLEGRRDHLRSIIPFKHAANYQSGLTERELNGVKFPGELAREVSAVDGTTFIEVLPAEQWTDFELASFSNKEFRRLASKANFVNRNAEGVTA